MECSWEQAGSLIGYSCSGGWGKECAQDEWDTAVYIVRGADFPAIAAGARCQLAQRWEKKGKVEKASLLPGDIIIEISGGTDDRPTGRTLFITQDFLRQCDLPVIPASFCRLVRPGAICSQYLYYWFQDMYAKGRTWGYQNRSTGLSNFQFKLFREEEVVRVPCSFDQIRIANTLFALDEAIRLNNRINDYLAELLDAKFEKMLETSDGWNEASLLDIASYKNGLAMQKFRPKAGDPGLPVLKIRELGQGFCGLDCERCRSDIDEAITVHDGDLIFSWSGTLLLDYWAGGDAGLNQHLFKVTSDTYPSWFYYMWTKYHLRKFIAMAKDRATTMGHIKRSALADSKVFIPDQRVLDKLTSSMQPIVDQVITNKVESRGLGKLRDALLPKLMSGEIDVSQIDLTQLNNHLSDC